MRSFIHEQGVKPRSAVRHGHWRLLGLVNPGNRHLTDLCMEGERGGVEPESTARTAAHVLAFNAIGLHCPLSGKGWIPVVEPAGACNISGESTN